MLMVELVLNSFFGGIYGNRNAILQRGWNPLNQIYSEPIKIEQYQVMLMVVVSETVVSELSTETETLFFKEAGTHWTVDV